MDTGDKIGFGCLGAGLLIFLAAAVGWIMNIGKLVATLADPISLLQILRLIGILVFPLGCVLGWF